MEVAIAKDMVAAVKKNDTSASSSVVAVQCCDTLGNHDGRSCMISLAES